jgi:SAM-dependent methyltransferase
MFHLLEHLPHPGLCLEEVRRVLGRGGWLVVQVPNADSLQRHLLGRLWSGFDVPRHLASYSPVNLRALLERNGFRVIQESHFSLRDNAAIPVMSLFPRLYPPARRLASGPRGAARRWINNALDLGFLFLVILATPLACGESLLGRGGTVVVVASKT